MRLLVTLLALLLWSGQAEARSQHISVSLIADTLEPTPGSTVTLGLRFQPDSGWHGYWTNPGDSGLAPEAHWKAPAGLKFGSLQHPAPTILRVAGISSYVHAGEHVLLSTVRIPASIPAGTKLPIKADLNWLACSDSLCVPERASLAIDLTLGNGTPSADSAAIRRAKSALPRSIATAGQYAVDNGDFRFALPAGARLDPDRARFFPDENGFLDASTTRLAGDGHSRELLAQLSGSPPFAITGVLSDGRRSYRVRFARGDLASNDAAPAETPSALPIKEGDDARPLADATPVGNGAEDNEGPSGAAVVSAQTDSERRLAPSILSAVLGAIAGGLLLNLMPCVFPILSLKALSLARSGGPEQEARREALGYTAGALLGTGLLGIAVVLLRQAGVEIGWSFQLQHPAVILFLLLLTFAIALNFAGLFKLPSLSVERGGASGSVATGALAAFIATPCSGPFMAAALGTAMLLPAAGALLVFLGLGFGLALPFLVIAFVPTTRRFLPRPGSWMATFRRMLAVPMLLTAVGLLWLIGRQGGTEVMTAAVILALILATSLWWVGLRQSGGRSRSWLPLAPAAALIALVVVAAPPKSASASAPQMADGIEPFSEARLAELRQAGTPVFVDFTADWCLTCKVNERVAIDRESTQSAFRRAGVVTLEGDWTNGDPAITRFLTRNGRNSIPFYLFVQPGEQPEVLPQILTPSTLITRAEASAT